MEKSNGKGRVIRNRYAKLQPLVNRINEIQGLNSASNYHPVKQYNESGIFESYAHQLQNDFENLVLVKSTETRAIEKPFDAEFQNSKIPMTAFFDQSISTPATNAETARKQKKYKHIRNKEKFNRTSILGLKTELRDILNCILYLMWSPIVFLIKLILTLARLLILQLYNMPNWFIRRSENSSQKEDGSQSVERKSQISKSLPPMNSPEEKRAPDLNEFLTKRSSEFNPESCSVSQEVKNGVTISQTQSENRRIRKELKYLKKKFDLSLGMVHEMHGNLESEGGNNLQYYSRRRDISNVELSSDCLSDKYNTSRFLDFNNEDGGKKPTRQYQDSISIAGNKTSSSALRKSTTCRDKQRGLHLNLRSSSRESELKFLLKNLETQMSDASESPEKQLQRFDLKNRSYETDKGCERGSAVLLVNNLRSTRFEKPRPYAIPSLPLRPTLEKKSSEGEDECEERIEKFDHTSSIDPESNLTAPSELQNSNLQPIVEPDPPMTEKFELFKDIDKDLSQKKELSIIAGVPIILNQFNGQKMEPDCDADFSSLHCKRDFSPPKNEATVSGCLKQLSNFTGPAQRDESKRHRENGKSPSSGIAVKDVTESGGISSNFEEEKGKNGSGDRPKVMRDEKSRISEFTKPIDAKSKWIEMKKKFYGKDYTAVKNLPEILEAEDLPRMKSVSKLPAHKIFQYNMLVGRARQMGTEQPSAEEIFLEKKATSPCVKVAENCRAGSSESRKPDRQLFKSAIPTSRCLSHTQSLSQWPDAGNSSRTKKQTLPELQRPKPKPRTEVGLNSEGFRERRKKSTNIHGAAVQFSQKQSTRVNSSVSSADVGNDQVLRNGVTRPLDWPLQMKNTAVTRDSNLSDDYTEKIDSLISFCSSYPIPTT